MDELNSKNKLNSIPKRAGFNATFNDFIAKSQDEILGLQKLKIF